jgi:hypothetical protein
VYRYCRSGAAPDTGPNLSGLILPLCVQALSGLCLSVFRFPSLYLGADVLFHIVVPQWLKNFVNLH